MLSLQNKILRQVIFSFQKEDHTENKTAIDFDI